MKNITQLREKLGQFKQGNELEHYDFIESLNDTYSHSINRVHVSYMNPNENCILFALKISGNSNYSNISRTTQKAAGNDFGNWLISNGKLEEIDRNQIKSGDLIAYLDGSLGFIHLGRYTNNNRVLSKWGAHGKFEHEIFEVPIMYGNNIKSYKSIKTDDAIELFRIYAYEE